jgi:AcrR family transcriptional regulator
MTRARTAARRVARPRRPVRGRPRPPRRTHAERTAETRAKVVAAVVDAIAERGFEGTTAQEIVARAGVTWGAVQHHFGAKNALLLAVLDDSFRRFAERLADLPVAGTTLAERADLFVERAWGHFASRHYRSTFEILLNGLGREAPTGPDDWRLRMREAWDEVWTRIFADARASHQRSLMLQHYAIAVLTGLATTRMLQGSGGGSPQHALALLKATLAQELTRRG